MADKFEGIRLTKTHIEHSRASYSHAGIQARLETGRQLRERVQNLDNLSLLSGLRAQLLKEGVEDVEAYFTISGPTFEWAIPIDAKNIEAARAFAIKVNAARTES